MNKTIISLSVALALSGCSLMPEYQRPAAPVAAAVVAPSASKTVLTEAAAPAWRSFFRDAALQQLINTALDNNRDLRAAALNVEAFQAQYRIQQAASLPSVGMNASGTRQRTPADLSRTGSATISSQYGVNVGLSAWELDLFGKIRSLENVALEQYLSTVEAQRSVQMALVASVANAWLTLQADRMRVALSQDTLRAYEQSLSLVQQSAKAGMATAMEVAQSRTAVDGARVSLTQYQRQVAQDENALRVLLGQPELPAVAAVDLERVQWAELPAGVASSVLLRRPDILQAEHSLQAANANIGAARAAFFPSISLTATAGTSSTQLSGLFDNGSGAWVFQPQINLPLFNAGRLQASLDAAVLQKEQRVAQYEQAIQNAFREVSDGLIARTSYREQLNAQQALLASSQEYQRLAEVRYRTGIDSQLTLLDAQRQLFSARQQWVTTRFAQLSSEVALFRALGGGLE
ncbi:MAG: efflux transporter outer membrane subunit [Pseudomonas sp.]